MTDVNMTQFTLDNEIEKSKHITLSGDDLTKISGVGKSLELKLKEKGFTTFAQIARSTPQKISRKIERIGIKKAQTLINFAKELFEQDDPKTNSESKYEGGMMFNPKYHIDRTSKIIPFHKELIKEKPSEYTQEELNNSEISTQEASEYDSFIVEPSIENENPNKEFLNDLDEYEKEKIITDDIELVEQNHTPEKFDEHTVFHPDIEQKIKNLVNTFIKNESEEKTFPSTEFEFKNNNLLPKEMSTPKAKGSDSEKESYMYKDEIEIEKEMLSTTKLNELTLQAKNKFQSKQYTILSQTIEGIDFLALKIFHVNDELKMISIIPVNVCNLEGSLIIANSKIEYYPINNESEANEFITDDMFDHIEHSLKKAQKNIFWNISAESKFFQYLKRKYDRKLEIEKTKRKKKLFLRAGHIHYKIIIDPIVLCKYNAEFNEKILPFPYQRESNIHFIQINKLSELLTFLEQKYVLIESRYNNKNVVKSYFHAQDKFIANMKYYSIPFAGILFGLLLIMVSIPLFGHVFFNLSLGVITIYGIIVGYLYLNFYKKKNGIIDDFATPYYKRVVKLDETDLEIIYEKLSFELMDQFIYECFGKDAKFNVIASIEAKKADAVQYYKESEFKDILTEQDEENEFLLAKGRNDNMRKKNDTIGTNYHLFMED